MDTVESRIGTPFRMIRWAWALLMLLAVSVPARAEPMADALQALLDGFVREQRLPGAVLSVAGPRLDVTVASGVLDRKSGARVTAQSRFYVASVGKMATAASILQLVDEGRIRLDQPVAEILGPAGSLERLPNWRTVTVEQLLNHTSGIPDYFDSDYEEAALKERRMLVDVERALSLVVGQDSNAKPGTAYEYSNTNFALLGLILERIDHSDLGTVLARRIFAPAGMTNSSVGADPREPGVASAHASRRKPSARDNLIAYGSRLGDGPITTTAGDLSRFLLALLRDKRLVKPASLQRMLTPSRREASYGLGIEISDTDWGPAFGHNGSVTGFNADAWYYAARQTSFVFMTNGEYGTDDTDIITRAATIVFSGSP
jgi:D-alanyl-D-alanine carboxypeptidase